MSLPYAGLTHMHSLPPSLPPSLPTWHRKSSNLPASNSRRISSLTIDSRSKLVIS
jgi:hypothetical protein